MLEVGCRPRTSVLQNPEAGVRQSVTIIFQPYLSMFADHSKLDTCTKLHLPTCKDNKHIQQNLARDHTPRRLCS